jgi:uncharacterized protein (DUF1697 family)
MPRKNVHIALLRGINVGKAKRIAMADLRGVVANLGYHDVRTLLNSGNVVYTAPRGSARQSAEKLERALLSELGIASRIIGLTRAELDEIIDANPIPAAIDTPSRYLIAVLRDEAVTRAIEPISRLEWDGERIVVRERAAYIWAPAGVLESRVIEAVGKAGGDGITVRTWSTLGKIAAAAREIGG